jgi:hypothetical protein
MKTQEMLYMTLEELLNKTVYVVESTDIEYDFLYHREQKSTSPVNWQRLNGGYLPTVGQLDNMPVTISTRWAEIDGHLVMFWNSPSVVTDQRLVERYLEKFFFIDGEIDSNATNTTATNFHLCLNYLSELEKADLVSKE